RATHRPRPAQPLRRAGERRRRIHEEGVRGVHLARGEEERRVAMNEIADARDIIIAPIVSEKSYGLLDENKYNTTHRPAANKTSIKQAVEAVFGVKVTNVNTLNRPGKRKRTRFGYGKRKDTKRAIVSLAEGERIDIFGGTA